MKQNSPTELLKNERQTLMNKSGKNTEKHPIKWYKLDLSANVYPTLQRKDFSSVFRLSVTLTEPVDPALLEQAGL